MLRDGGRYLGLLRDKICLISNIRASCQRIIKVVLGDILIKLLKLKTSCTIVWKRIIIWTEIWGAGKLWFLLLYKQYLIQDIL
jgi:hypothetical protein